VAGSLSRPTGLADMLAHGNVFGSCSRITVSSELASIVDGSSRCELSSRSYALLAWLSIFLAMFSYDQSRFDPAKYHGFDSSPHMAIYSSSID